MLEAILHAIGLCPDRLSHFDLGDVIAFAFPVVSYVAARIVNLYRGLK
jgi:hypothetical protein